MAEIRNPRRAERWINPTIELPLPGLPLDVLLKSDIEPVLAYYDYDGFRVVGSSLVRTVTSVGRWRYAIQSSSLVWETEDR